MAGSVAIAAACIPEALAHLARQSKKEKVDLVKLMITGGVLDAKEKGCPGRAEDVAGYGACRLRQSTCRRLYRFRPCGISGGCPRGSGKWCRLDRARCEDG
ncbi:MAG: hypothetical protein ACLSHP_09140 [Coprococcus sp.]